MHGDEARPGLGRDLRYAGLALKAPHVVDDMRACRHGEPGRLLPVGVDGDENVAARAQRLDDRQDARLFFRRGHGGGTGPCRFAADIDDRGAVADHGFGLRDGGIGAIEAAAIGKAVGRDVEHPHDDGFRPKHERTTVGQWPCDRDEHRCWLHCIHRCFCCLGAPKSTVFYRVTISR